ncbi:hypothetical protein V6N13_040221 [Hibiscus sabdariffa]|uniref:Uncharacterized protein n=1 Tax=Hibiscus sabdariffa TaxID=183260 RepID=A0ABR2ST55_9ROSI
MHRSHIGCTEWGEPQERYGETEVRRALEKFWEELQSSSKGRPMPKHEPGCVSCASQIHWQSRRPRLRRRQEEGTIIGDSTGNRIVGYHCKAVNTRNPSQPRMPQQRPPKPKGKSNMHRTKSCVRTIYSANMNKQNNR